jgi:hypothetical protein
MRWKRECFYIAAAPACRAIKLRTELTLSPVGYVEQRRSGPLPYPSEHVQD